MSILKWITGGVGFVVAGPIGAILGVGAGFLLEELMKGQVHSDQRSGRTSGGTARNDFTLSFLVLIAAVIKADGKIHRSELDFVKGHLISLFGPVGAEESMRVLQGIIQQPIPVEKVSRQVAANMDYPSRLELLHLLYGVAASDGHIPDSEETLLNRIAQWLGLNPSDSQSIKAMFFQKRESPYDILEISPQAEDSQVKTAYRTMAQKYHPDKVAHLGEEYQKQAQEKFTKVNEAFEKIKQMRNM